MAINPETQYPGKIAPSTPDYPYGAARNITVPGDGTGTPWEAALVNDLFGFQQALLGSASVVPSGTPEKVGASQYLHALNRGGVRLWDTSTPYQVGALTIASSGVIYQCLTANTGNDPVSDGGANWKRWKSEEYVSIVDFGAKGDGVTDDTASIQAALDTGLDVLIPDGNFLASNVTMSEDQTVFGHGRKSVLLTSATDAAITVNNRTTLINFAITPSSTDTSFVHPNDDFDDPERNFDYKDVVVGIAGSDLQEINITGMYIAQLWRGIGLGRCKYLKVTNNLIKWIGVWQTQFFDCRDLIFDSNICIYGGSSGGVAASSTKRAVFSNNRVIGSGTGINTGGSPDPAFNVEQISVTGNHVQARDCINLENGVAYATVTGNVCEVFENQDLPGTTGVGIAFTSDSAGGAAGLISHVNATGNTIKAYSRNFAIGITARTQATDYDDEFESVVIANNEISGANFGVTVTCATDGVFIDNVVVEGNIVLFPTKGFQLVRCRNLVAQGNITEQGGSQPLSGFQGFDLNICNVASIQDNHIKGFGEGIDLDVDCLSVYLEDNIFSAHRTSGTSGSRLVSATDSYFNDDEAGQTITDTGNRLIINSPFVNYSPGVGTVINGLVGGYSKGGKIITFKWDGNVTLQNSTYMILLGGVTTAPPADSRTQFVVLRGGTVQEIFRSY